MFCFLFFCWFIFLLFVFYLVNINVILSIYTRQRCLENTTWSFQKKYIPKQN
jgi:hypothetical protein